jgi:hypothetical protein
MLSNAFKKCIKFFVPLGRLNIFMRFLLISSELIFFFSGPRFFSSFYMSILQCLWTQSSSLSLKHTKSQSNGKTKLARLLIGGVFFVVYELNPTTISNKNNCGFNNNFTFRHNDKDRLWKQKEEGWFWLIRNNPQSLKFRKRLYCAPPTLLLTFALVLLHNNIYHSDTSLRYRNCRVFFKQLLERTLLFYVVQHTKCNSFCVHSAQFSSSFSTYFFWFIIFMLLSINDLEFLISFYLLVSGTPQGNPTYTKLR